MYQTSVPITELRALRATPDSEEEPIYLTPTGLVVVAFDVHPTLISQVSHKATEVNREVRIWSEDPTKMKMVDATYVNIVYLREGYERPVWPDSGDTGARALHGRFSTLPTAENIEVNCGMFMHSFKNVDTGAEMLMNNKRFQLSLKHI